MRIDTEIGDELLWEALRCSGLKTERGVVEAGLTKASDPRQQAEKDPQHLAGKVHWEGNLDESREGRFPPDTCG